MEFSKILAICILGFYGLAVIVCALLFATWNIDIKFTLDYLQPLAIATLSVYGLKAGAENIQKLKNNVTVPKNPTNPV
jgi:hypothetical protein